MGGKADRSNDGHGDGRGGSRGGGSSGGSSGGGRASGSGPSSRGGRTGRGPGDVGSGNTAGEKAEAAAARGSDRASRERQSFERANPEIGMARRETERRDMARAAASRGIGSDYDHAAALAEKAKVGALSPMEHEIQAGMVQGVKQQTMAQETASFARRAINATLGPAVGAPVGAMVGGLTNAAVDTFGTAPNPHAEYGRQVGLNAAKPSTAESVGGMIAGAMGVPSEVSRMAKPALTANRVSSITGLEAAVNSRKGVNSAGQQVGPAHNPGTTTDNNIGGGQVAEARTKTKSALSTAPQVTATALNTAPTIDTANMNRGLLDAARAFA